MLTFVSYKADMLIARGKAVSASKDHSLRSNAQCSLQIFKQSMQCLTSCADKAKQLPNQKKKKIRKPDFIQSVLMLKD